MFIGFMAFTLGVLGIVSLFFGNPAATDGYEALAAAARFVGAIAAHPLSSVISVFGAAIVCLGLAVLGMLIFTGTPISTAWRRLRDFFTAADVEEDEEEEVAEDEPGLQIGFDEPAPPKVSRVRRLREALGLVDDP